MRIDNVISASELARVSGGQQALSPSDTFLQKAKDCTELGQCTAPTPDEARAALQVFKDAGPAGYTRHLELHEALMEKYMGAGPFLPKN
jgi:hypothetical protein